MYISLKSVFMSTTTNKNLVQISIQTIRTLAMDAVQTAKSGHPGTPMALAPVAYLLYNEVMRYDPSQPTWPNRDRFVLSCGHASMLLYAILPLAGVKKGPGSERSEVPVPFFTGSERSEVPVPFFTGSERSEVPVPFFNATEELAVPLDEIRQFRQLNSRCPGHPEFGHTSGVETTTGPLGQGIGNSVGMAIASRWLAARYNKPGFDLFNFNVYSLCSDGDLMEGVG